MACSRSLPLQILVLCGVACASPARLPALGADNVRRAQGIATSSATATATPTPTRTVSPSNFYPLGVVWRLGGTGAACTSVCTPGNYLCSDAAWPASPSSASMAAIAGAAGVACTSIGQGSALAYDPVSTSGACYYGFAGYSTCAAAAD